MVSDDGKPNIKDLKTSRKNTSTQYKVNPTYTKRVHYVYKEI